MNRILCTFVTASVLVSGAAFGQSTSNKTTQAKQPLRDTQMDKVTAGHSDSDPVSGGSIAANNSSVTTSATGTVDLSGTSLEGASGVNIVRSSDAMVGNGVNVYDSSVSSSSAKVKQSNDVSQTESTGAAIGSYHRGENSQLTVNKSSNVTANDTSSSSVNASLNAQSSSDKSYSNLNSTTDTKSNSFTTTDNKQQQASASKSFRANESSSASIGSTKSTGTTNALGAN